MFFKKKYPNMTDHELWKAFRNGSGQAFSELFGRYSKKVSMICYSFSKDTETTKDLVQEIALKMLEMQSSPQKEEIRGFGNWFGTIARNHCLSFYAKQKRQKEILENKVRPLKAKAYELKPEIDSEKAKKSIGKLKPDHQKILRLTHDGYSNPEIAQNMNKSTPWVQKNKHLAREAFKQVLKMEGLFPETN